MPSLSTFRTVPYRSTELYQLILDVESYPEFLPFCRRATVLKREVTPEKTLLIVEMEVGFGSLREQYTSEIIGDPRNRIIRIRALEGPFRFLRGLWRFEGVHDYSTSILFEIEYAFKSRLLGLMAGKVFDRVFRSMVAAFEDRAKSVLKSDG